MGKFYTNSYFTIVAIAGADAEAGLPGIRVPRTATQNEVTLVRGRGSKPPISLLTTLAPTLEARDHFTKNTVWASRGWTLQERALTRRAILVTKEQIAWSCCKSRWVEEMSCETPLAQVNWLALHESEYFLNSSVSSLFASNNETDQVWYRLRRLILDYTQRNLTVEGDALDAFSAILQQVREKEGEHFLWGIPATRFELGLCWEPHHRGLRRRTCLSTLAMTTLKRKVPFPSWSWIGWHGGINFRVEDRYLELGCVFTSIPMPQDATKSSPHVNRLDPVILCYVLRQSPLRLVRVSRLSMDTPNPAPWQLASALFKSPLAVTLGDIEQNCSGLTQEYLTDIPDDQLVFFWTDIARFTVSTPTTMVLAVAANTTLEDRYTYHYRTITDRNGNTVGRTAACEAGSNDETNEGGECEFILVASNTPPEHERQKLVMQIKRRDDGVAYRVNIADVSAGAWERAGAVRALVALG
jgi:hypothetical protein